MVFRQNVVYPARMARQIDLQQAKAEHYDFCLHLFLLTMRPYMQELNVWDEQEQRSNFAAQWKLEEVRIISVDGNDAGWLQVAELPAEIRLQKFFIFPRHQRSGIGSEVLSKLLATWRPTGKKVVLRVLKNNPARRLYERLGFSVVAEAGVVFRMRA
jgi:GNAT superfamily N-acetyltransferase